MKQLSNTAIQYETVDGIDRIYSLHFAVTLDAERLQILRNIHSASLLKIWTLLMNELRI